MDKQGFRVLLEKRKCNEAQIEASMAMAERFEAYLQQPGREASAETAWEFSRQLIAEGQNSEENYIALIRYCWFIKNNEMFVALLELVDGGEVGGNLYQRVGERFGTTLQDEIFAGIGVTPYGTPTPEKPATLQPVIRRLEQAVGKAACQDFLSASLRDLPDAYYQGEREKYDRAGNIDAYLRQRKEAFLGELEACQRDGRLFFSQEITDEVLEFVRKDPEMGGGRREGNIIYEVKIPYQTKEYLAATDPTMKRFYGCHCPWARTAIKNQDVQPAETFCYCSGGFHKKAWEVVFEQPLRVEVLESILWGDERCRFAITLPEEALADAEKQAVVKPLHRLAGLVMLFLAACSASEGTPPVPTVTHTIPPTTIPTATLAPTPTPIPPFLPPLEVISVENASQARLLQILSIPDFSSATVSQCSAAFSPDGSLLAAVCDNSTVPVWEVNSGRLQFTLLDEPSHEVAVAFSPDGSQIAIGGFGGEIRLFDAANGLLLATFPTLRSPVWDLDFTPDGQRLAAANFFDAMYLWQVATHELDWTYGADITNLSPLSVDVHPSGSPIAFGTALDGIFILDAESGAELRRLRIIVPYGDVVFSPDGSLLAGGSDDNRIRLWSTENYELAGNWVGHRHWVNGVTFSPDGSLLFSGSHDRMVGIWDVRSGDPLTMLAGHEGVVLRVAVNPAGTLIASTSWDGTVRLWGVAGE